MNNKDITYYLSILVNSKIVKSNSGGGAGSILKIEINNKDSYFFIYCCWRLESDATVLATSADDTTANIGLIAKSVKLLEGKTILSINLSKQYDLIIVFEDGYTLRVFCDISYSSSDNEDYYDTNWELCIPTDNAYFKVSNKYQIETGKYY
ncbi:MAG: hypothetical protein RL662_753 [Bacteroidota bacterium]|jgi:hypothetical protein